MPDTQRSKRGTNMSAETPVKGDFQKNPQIDTVLFVGPNGTIGKVMIPILLDLGYRVRALANKTLE
jgi:hypothetical protein